MNNKPGVVLLDLATPKTNGLGAHLAFRRRAPKARVLILSSYRGPETVPQRVGA